MKSSPLSVEARSPLLSQKLKEARRKRGQTRSSDEEESEEELDQGLGTFPSLPHIHFDVVDKGSFCV